MPQNERPELEQVYSIYLRDWRFWATQFRMSREDYEDCVQETWIKAASKLAEHDPMESGLRTWFHRILFRQILTATRRRRNEEKPARVAAAPGPASFAQSGSDSPAPLGASGEFHVLRAECQQAVQDLLAETDELLRLHAPAHKAAFDRLINDAALNELCAKLERSQQSIGASMRRKRKEFVSALNAQTPLGERLRRIKALVREIAELRRMLNESLECPVAPAPPASDGNPGDDE